MINYKSAHIYQTLYQVLAAQNDQAVNLTMHPRKDYNPPPCQETWQGVHNMVSTPRVGVRDPGSAKGGKRYPDEKIRLQRERGRYG